MHIDGFILDKLRVLTFKSSTILITRRAFARGIEAATRALLDNGFPREMIE